SSSRRVPARSATARFLSPRSSTWCASAPARLTRPPSDSSFPRQRERLAPRGWRLGERQHLFPKQPLAQQAFQHGLALARAKPLAVDDPYAAEAAPTAMAQEFGHVERCHVAVHAVQVELRFHHPVPAPELAQHLALYAFAQIDQLVAGIQSLVYRERPGERFGERGALVAQALPRYGRRPPTMDHALTAL